MAMPTRPFTRVEVQTAPFEGGLVDAAERLGRLRNESVEMVASSMTVVPDALCGHPGLTDGFCEVDDSITVDAVRVSEAMDWEYGPVFATYRQFQCLPGTDMQGFAEKSLERNETHAVESAFQQALYLGVDYVTPTVLNGGVAVSMLEALALLEQEVGRIGGGVVHATRYGATYLASTRYVKDESGMLVTKQGTPIVAGAGYVNESPAGVAATGKTFWVFLTPMFSLARSPIMYHETYTLSQNEQDGLAERAWTAALDCGEVIAVLVDPEA